MRKKFFNFSPWWLLSIGLILAIIIAGSLVTQHIRNNDRRDIINDGESAALTLSIYTTSELKKTEGAIQALAGSPWILPALISRKDQDIERANSVLDRYNSALNTSVCYLMDTHGMTLASSNRNAPDSFVGKSYGFRPYFQDAIKGNLGYYFAQGITSGKRGFYAGFPVKDRDGKIMGVAAVKRDLAELEIFFKKFPYCFFVNRSGIIFLSSKPQMTFKSLWPIDGETRASLAASQQFGDNPFEAIFQREITDGMDVVFGGGNYLVSRKAIDHAGWSVVILSPADPLNAEIYLVIIATVLACLFAMIFSGIIYFVDNSRRKIKQGEERFRELFNSMKSGVALYKAVDDGHDFLFKDFNRAAETIENISKEDVIGKSVLALFPAVKEFGLLEVFQNVWKTGIPQSHPVSQYKDGRIEGWRENYVYKLPSGEIVAIYDDVTKSKQTEEALQESESRLSIIFEALKTGIAIIDPENHVIVDINMAAAHMIGTSKEHIIGSMCHKYICPAEVGRCPITDLGETVNNSERVLLTAGGEKIPIIKTVVNVMLGGRKHLLESFVDITERKRMEEEIRELSLNDQLTGIYNRRGFLTLVEPQLKLSSRTEKVLLLFFTDLDGLKWINDTLGHEEGDRAIVEMASVLKEAFRSSDIIARLGGDEFAVLAIEPEKSNPEILINRLQSRIDRHNNQENRRYKLSVSVGYSFYDPQNPSSIDELIASADKLMYEQKQKKKSRPV